MHTMQKKRAKIDPCCKIVSIIKFGKYIIDFTIFNDAFGFIRSMALIVRWIVVRKNHRYEERQINHVVL